MRSGRALARRTGRQTPPVMQQPGVPRTVPAPVGGWNARDPLAEMNPLDAVVMDNFYPSTGTVDLRAGRAVWATGLTGSVKAILAYNSVSSQKLFASTENGIYDISTSGVVGAAVATCTSGKWEYRVFTTAGGIFLVAVNGVDKLKVYDGATWKVIDGASTPAITGITTSDIVNLNIFKRRLWFVLKNSLSAYYLGIDSFGGAAVEFPMGPAFTKGGYIVAQANWTIDGGQGVDDYLVTVTSEGELVIYQGTDPATVGAFALVGTYDVGKPLGRKCFTKYGGDLLYLSRQGVFPLSKLLQSATLEKTKSLNDKIGNAFKESILSYGNNNGWMIKLHPTQSAVVVNVPMVEGQSSVQYVMNDITKAWCRFTGWDADVFEIFQTDLYSGLGSTVYKNWVGTVDGTVPITGKCQQAYISLGGAQKAINLLRPNMNLQGLVTVQTALDSDFNLFGSVDQSVINYGNGFNLWDSGTWDSSVWSGGLSPTGRQWFTCANNPGFFHSFRLQCTSSTASLSWVSTDYVFQRAGLL